MSNYRVFNLTKSVISITLDEVNYHLMPAGYSNPETGLRDNCIMLEEHFNHPKTQVFILSNPPKLAGSPVVRIDNSDKMEKMLNATISEANNKIAEYRKNLDKVLKIENTKISEDMKKMMSGVSRDVDEIRGKVNDAIAQIENLKEQIKKVEKVEPPKTQSNNNRKGPTRLFDKEK